MPRLIFAPGETRGSTSEREGLALQRGEQSARDVLSIHLEVRIEADNHSPRSSRIDLSSLQKISSPQRIERSACLSSLRPALRSS